jgi:hypothetical protein
MEINNPKVVARFWSRVSKSDGCWLWTGATGKGYGNFMVRGKVIRASRFSYALHKGEIGDMYVCHRCDNPTCVNPDHLFLGTAADNLQDAIQKGRFPVARDMVKVRAALEATGTWFKNGEDHPGVRLTESGVVDIRRLHASGVSQHELARRYGVARKTISHVVYRRTWVHVA